MNFAQLCLAMGLLFGGIIGWNLSSLWRHFRVGLWLYRQGYRPTGRVFPPVVRPTPTEGESDADLTNGIRDAHK